MVRSRRSFRPINEVPQKRQTRPIILYAPVYNSISAAFAFSSSSPFNSHLLTFPNPQRPWPSHTLHIISPGQRLHSFRSLCSHTSSILCLFGIYSFYLSAPSLLATKTVFPTAKSSTLNAHPDLFTIVTPIKINTFRELLWEHPNHPFTGFILHGLREGVWHGTDTAMDSGYPLTWDNSYQPLKSEKHRAFVQEQVDEEVRIGYFSLPFGPELLASVYSSTAVHVVPKHNSPKLCLVIDHSAREISLNSMINLDDLSGVKLRGCTSASNGEMAPAT
ncbi:uncharacterized protein BJ212DRAFT_1474230 [Suillus subaureus]|uniref:Uncharacterized protein n=1 Tax=Suillus subaureus TaxID=48587 RepID=A0A9P7JKB2_9AGAM|nr:uncharacterized protein BJ212DRAFT_1474230 [Suillus subaureus]KAG1827039.1 hypothetical protein BJ212DRAFT_1474230 [Suillus subaureus]